MKNRSGLSLIEVMVAITLLGMIATVHSLVTMRYALRNRVAAVGVNRAAAISNAVDLFTTMPFAAIATNAVCADIATPNKYPHRRCVTTTVVNNAITRVRIIITPTNTAFRPDTVSVDRSRPPSGSLFT